MTDEEIEALEVGDIVLLQSGGPQLTVTEIGADMVRCRRTSVVVAWIADGRLGILRAPAACFLSVDVPEIFVDELRTAEASFPDQVREAVAQEAPHLTWDDLIPTIANLPAEPVGITNADDTEVPF